MIIDLKKFIAGEQAFWEELDTMLSRAEADPYRVMTFDEIRRLHYLYQRTSADLVKINTVSAEGEIRRYLEAMVGRAYGFIYGSRTGAVRFSFWEWFLRSFPRTFRRHYRMFVLSLCIMGAGGIFGAGAVLTDPDAKSILLPFAHLRVDPDERVAEEETASSRKDETERGEKSSFSAFLMTHNTRISILVLALGMTWGVGTAILLFSNGVILGAVIADFIRAGQSVFLTGWLLPHGSIEIPSILFAGQAGFILAAAIMGGKSGKSMRRRLKEAGPDVVTLIGGVAVLLVWAGIIEAFFSQYHEPVIPYALKIAFGIVELVLLSAYLLFSGTKNEKGSST